MPTQIPYGSPLARKIYGAALFASVQQAPGFTKLMSGPAPQQSEAESKLKGQTAPDYPIVKITDLSVSAGDSCSVDLFNMLQGKPVMGDNRLAGRAMALTYSSMDVKINQYRGLADPGGRMTQKRTVHNLRGIAKSALTGWANRLEDQISIVHLAGARGSQNQADWVVPLAADADYSTIMVNTVKAPTYNRHFYAGDATGLANLDTADLLDLPTIDRLAAVMNESDVPLQPVKVKDDQYGWDNPTWLLLVTQRQWLYLQTRTGEKAWRTFLQNAYKRWEGNKHPLFFGDCGMWAGILIRPTFNRIAIRFAQSEVVTVATSADTYTETTATCAVATDRALLLGAQALAKAFGKHGQSDYHYSWFEELVDHENGVEISMAAMGGAAKVRFNVKTGTTSKDTDMGVAVVDSYAPDPASSAGKALL
jgi:N4-gp56 family major capsid protein